MELGSRSPDTCHAKFFTNSPAPLLEAKVPEAGSWEQSEEIVLPFFRVRHLVPLQSLHLPDIRYTFD